MGINNFVVSLDRATKRRHDEPVFFICATGVHGTHPQTPFMLLWDILFQCSCSYLREVSNDTNLEEHRDVDSRLRPLYKKNGALRNWEFGAQCSIYLLNLFTAIYSEFCIKLHNIVILGKTSKTHNFQEYLY